MTVIRVSAPEKDPVTVEDLKKHSIIEFSDDDDYLGVLIGVATEIVERESGLLFVEQRWVESCDGFPVAEIELSKAPVRSITSIKYIDSDGSETTMSNDLYQNNLDAKPALLLPAYGEGWPSTRSQYGAVKIEYSCGFSALDEAEFSSVPKIAKQAIRMMAYHLYDNREVVSPVALKEIPCGVAHLIRLIAVVGL